LCITHISLKAQLQDDTILVTQAI